MANRDFKGIWIPKEIWLDENLSLREKCFLVEIDSLDCSDQGCFASNSHFAKFSGLSKNRCSEIISSLEEKGYIKVELKYKEDSEQIEKRVIRVTHKYFGYSEKRTGGYSENPNRGSENTKDNNTINNTNNNKYNYKDVIDYLNEKAGKTFKCVETNNKLIRARYNEGYTLEDFYRVIDYKVLQWKGNEWEKYLRPSTLFSAKNFENYLNDSPPRSIDLSKEPENEVVMKGFDNYFKSLMEELGDE